MWSSRTSRQPAHRSGRRCSARHRHRPEARGDRVGTEHIGIAEDLEVLDGRVRERSGTVKNDSAVVAKIRRDIADPQAAIGGAVVGMGLDELCQRLGVPLVPAAVFFVDRLGVVAGAEEQRVEQIAVRRGIVRA